MTDTAVIPAAGYGKRMAPLSTVIPKEMFPLGHIPLIEHTIIELTTSGIKRICIVIREGKEVIRDYLFSRKRQYNEVEIYFAYQNAPLGLGDAITKAKDFIKGAPFLMTIPDQILISEWPATLQLLEASRAAEGIWNSMAVIPDGELSFFSGSRPFRYKKSEGEFYIIRDIMTDETSQVRGFGRTIFLPEVLEYMTDDFINEKTGEVDLLKTFQALKNDFPLYGTILKGDPCDLGTWEGYHYYQRLFLERFNPEGKFQ